MRARLRGATRLAVVVVASSVASVSGSDEASANPPAPERFPDPPVVAPKAAERPNVVRKHDGGCFVSYPSGGTAKVDCPNELVTEPAGQEIDRDDTTGKCRHVPSTSWSGGSTGEIPCPSVLLVVAKPGAMPDPAGTPSGAVGSNSAPVPSTFDPPMGGLSPQAPATVAPKGKDPSKRKDDDASPKAIGCASSCAIGARDHDVSTDVACAFAAFAALGVASTLTARRRVRRDA